MPDGEFDTETLRNGLRVMERDELASSRQIHLPVRNADDIADSFDAISYDKGAAVLSMFEGFLGEELFRKGLHAYLNRFAWRNASAKDFIGTIADTAARQPHPEPETVNISIDALGRISWNGHSVASLSALMDQLGHMSGAVSAPQIAQSFHSFVDQPGVPDLHVTLSCTGAASAQVSQGTYTPIGGRAVSRFWKIPFCLGVAGQADYCRLLDRKTTEVMLGANCPQALLPNVAGRGYFRTSLDAGNRAALIAKIASIAQAEQITLLYGLASGIHDGSVRPHDVFAAIANVASTARWDVLESIEDILHSLRLQSGFSASDVATYRKFVSARFASRFAAAGTAPIAGESADAGLTRARLAELMVTEARDPGAIAALSIRALALMQGNDVVAPELLGQALRAGILARGQDFSNRLLSLYQTTDNENLRRQIVYAFAGSDDPAVIRSLLRLALTPHMRVGELRYLYQYMSEEPVASAVLWTWLKENFAALSARAPRAGLSRIPTTLRRSCDPQSQDELTAFFDAHGGGLTGIARPVAEAGEEIAHCVAFRQAKGAEISADLREAAH
ncbi:MAG: ERAP1-like C-terminal domain-containing protein [Alphaproteobacteria bacterium]|nr:ERAP1-like C-terminal domain-containing protein [Alphaproteobacteria bacterium]